LRRLGRCAALAAPLLWMVGCGAEESGPIAPRPTPGMAVFSGNNQRGAPGQPLPNPLQVLLTDRNGFSAGAGARVAWVVAGGGGRVASDTTLTTGNGTAAAVWTLGIGVGGQALKAVWPGVDSVMLHATATGAFGAPLGGNNVPERFTSDLWVANGYAYAGTWNHVQRTPSVAGVIKVFQLGPSGAATLVDSVPLPTVNTVSDLEVSADGAWLVATTEGGSGEGLYAFSLTDPAKPVQKAFLAVSAGLHTGSLAVIGGKLFAFAAKNPPDPALLIVDLSDAANGVIDQASSTPIPPYYGIHDTFVRDGICFAFVWNEGVYIYDVGNGGWGGSPTDPVKVSGLRTSGGEAHNGWWFWNPATGERRYLFVGQEGPGTIGTGSSGDIHVVDVSDLAHPVEVASYSMPGAGTHNFWMDEQGQRLYAAYYNGGVVALDVSGTLQGSLASREIARVKPGGSGNTYIWGVMLVGSSLYASDMLSGLWQLGVP